MSEPFTMTLNFHRTPLKSGVYMIRSRHSRETYVGSSVNIPERWRAHRMALRGGRHHNRRLQNIYNKHGPEAFEWAQIASCPPEDVLKEEQEWLGHITCRLNLCPVVVSNRTGARNTPEHKAKIAAAAKAKWADPAFRARQDAGRKPYQQKEGAQTLTVGGATKPLSVWAKEAGISRSLLAYRLQSGMCPEDALKAPVERRNPARRAKHWFEGREWTTRDLAARFDVLPAHFLERLRLGWSLERALTTPVQACGAKGERNKPRK